MHGCACTRLLVVRRALETGIVVAVRYQKTRSTGGNRWRLMHVTSENARSVWQGDGALDAYHQACEQGRSVWGRACWWNASCHATWPDRRPRCTHSLADASLDRRRQTRTRVPMTERR